MIIFPPSDRKGGQHIMNFGWPHGELPPASPQVSHSKSSPVIPADHTVAIYTIMVILRLMKDRFGLEAMLEYISQYTAVIEKNNPQFQEAVLKAVSLMNIETLYKKAMNGEK